MEITEEEIEYFKRKTLAPFNMSEERFCEFHEVKNIKEYLIKDKQELIEFYLGDQLSLRDLCPLVRETLQKIPLYDLEKILDEFTEIKQVFSSECHAVMTTNKLIESFALERKYKAAYEFAKSTRWIILLYKPDFKKRSKEYCLFTIAHELAHRRLEHTTFTSLPPENPYILEDEADALAEKWGFKKPKNWLRYSKARRTGRVFHTSIALQVVAFP